MSVVSIGEVFAFHDTARFDSVWGRVPQEKMLFYRAAEATIIAANAVFTNPPECKDDEAARSYWEQRGSAAKTYWERGYADKLIASVESACAYWQMSEGAYIEAVERISEWFGSKGWTHLERTMKETLEYAYRVHNSAETLRRTASEAFKGGCGTARNSAATKR